MLDIIFAVLFSESIHGSSHSVQLDQGHATIRDSTKQPADEYGTIYVNFNVPYGDNSGVDARSLNELPQPEEMEGDVLCELCHLTLPTKKCLEYHTALVHNKFCDVCRERIDDDPDPGNHGRKHIGCKPIHCDHCFKGFQTESGLKLHLSKPLMCKICFKTFKSNYKSQHMKSHTLGEK
ncbi:unnamed protein product [Owenia fusiformis]|uniref:C2H2-type domain-containing protein n=1 Tax=Owenia fusiformis TaxID=6347 RepID=A0A8S4N8N9_OWEFU|nr:unnamed protein product [Owenia fusiformis]